MPWYLDENYYNSLMNHFNKDFNIKLKKNLIDENIFIIIDSNASFSFSKKFYLDNYETFQIPYSYQHKNLSIILPKNCYSEIKL